jgi:OOP family OmpA-OmpF porin
MLGASTTMQIEVGGHTDNRGRDATNQRLSAERAQAVAAYFAAHGADASRIRAVGYGKARPVAANDTDEGRQLNRRVEIIIIKP